MALQIHILHYGQRTIPVNNAEYALKIANGLQRMATALTALDTEFVDRGIFAQGDADNTWVHVCLLTESTTTLPPPSLGVEEPENREVVPVAQFNVHLLMKHVADEEELAEGLTTTAREK